MTIVVFLAAMAMRRGSFLTAAGTHQEVPCNSDFVGYQSARGIFAGHHGFEVTEGGFGRLLPFQTHNSGCGPQ
jgi:hypothetical protein